METRIRIRVGNVELEVVGEEEFVTNRLPNLVADLMARLVLNDVSGAEPPPGDMPLPDTRFVSIAGDIRDYWTNTLIAEATISTIGLLPKPIVQSDEAGRFILSGQSTGQQCYLLVSGHAGYVETSNLVESSSGSVIFSAVAVAIPDISRQYTSVGLTFSPDMTILIVDLLDSKGGPLEGVSAGDITLKTEIGNPVGNGPYFFGASGDVQNQATMPISQAFANRARVAFLSVPPGEHILQVTAAGAANVQATVAVLAARGATVVRARLPT